MSAREAAAATFVFADIAGFTALTEAHGDLEATDLVARLLRRGPGRAPARLRHVREDDRGRGHAARIEDPAEAFPLDVRIVDGLMTDQAPAVRVGLHHGRAIQRDGDYVGAAQDTLAQIAHV